MSQTLTEKVEYILNEKVRPYLASHQGNVQLLSVNRGVVRIRLTGKCSACPSAQLTTEEFIATNLQEAYPQIKKVILVSGVSDSLIAQAKQVLRYGHF